MSTPLQEGKVKQVLSGDTLLLQSTANRTQERTLSLAFITSPRLQADEPSALESRDFLRKLCVGKLVHFRPLYSIPAKAGGGVREYGTVTLAGGKVLPDLVVQEGWGKIRDDADRRVEGAAGAGEILERLRALEAHARADGKGVWDPKAAAVENVRELGDAKIFAEQHKEPIEAVVERVLSGDRVICRLMVEPKRHYTAAVLIAGLKAPSTARTNPSDGSTQPAEPLGSESQAFVEERLLQRGVQVRLLGVSPNNVLVGEVRHPVGNIAEFLLKEGLARCVDHHSTWLGAEMGKLRQAERSAKERHVGIFKAHNNATTPRQNGGESEAVVSRILSADTLYLRNKSGAEKRVTLSSIRQPKPTDPKQAPFTAEAKEFLRKRLIGKHVKLTTDGTRPATEGYDAREMATLVSGGKNVALGLVENGYASVIRHRMDDTDRSSIYDDLLAAEEAAQKDEKGMWSSKPPQAAKQYVDYSESLEKAKRQLTLLSKQKRVPAVVDFVKSGSRFTILIPRENAKLTLVLGGIRAPRSARNASDTAEPFGQEAHDYAARRCMQRDVEIDVEDCDKQGGFIGTMYVNRESFARVLVEEGLASVHAYSAEKTGNSGELFAAETKAKESRKGLWHDWTPEAEDAVNGHDTTAEAGASATNGTTTNGETPLPPRERNYKDVLITHIDPACARLKLQILSSGNKSKLDSLMRDFAAFNLNSSATSSSFSNSIPPKAGDLVSAKFTQDGVWYRARVRRNDREKKESEVVYIDYGNSELQPWTSLRPLEGATFGTQKLAPQAVDAALSFLQFPTTNAEYLSDAVGFLSDTVLERELVANIDFTDSRDNNLLWVTLMDPQKAGSLAQSFNSEVIGEGLAMVAKKVRPFERAAPEVLRELREREEEAKAARRGMWEYGDLTED